MEFVVGAAAVDLFAGAAEGVAVDSEFLLQEENFRRMQSAKSTMTRVAKRLRFGDDDGGGDYNHQGPRQWCQEVNIKRGRKRRTISRLLKKIDRTNVSMINRFQSLTDNWQKSLVLSQICNYYVDESSKVFLPVYAFNLTALARNKTNNGGSVVDGSTKPFYRLTKDSQNRYRFDVVLGAKNQSGTTDNDVWFMEDRTQATNTNTLITDYTLDWVNCRLMIKGAHDLDSHVDVFECRFLTDGGPVRKFWNGTTTVSEDPEPTGDIENETTAFWDHYLASRTTHPFRTSMLPKNAIDKYWQIIRHKKISFSPVSDGNKVEGTLGDAVGYSKCLNMFMRYDRDVQLRSVNPNIDVSDKIVGGTVPQELAYAVNDGNTQLSLYGPRDSDRWLIISAVAMTKSSTAGENPSDYVSFDMCIRQKVLYDEN